MSMKQKYFKLQLKRRISKYPVVLAVSILTAMAVLLCGYGVISDNMTDENNLKINVGVVGDTKDTYLGVGVSALQNIDSSRFAVNFEEMDEKEAERKLLRDELNGYIAIPDNFVKDILRGKNTPATYYIRKSAPNFGTLITGEITQTVSELVCRTQTAIYGMQSAAEFYGKKKGINDKIESLNVKYINTVLGRNKVFDIRTIGVADNLSYGGYYLCAFAMLIMILWGISFASVSGSGSKSVSKLLKSYGVSEKSQILSEYGSQFIVLFFTVLIFLLIFSSLFGGRLPIEEIKYFGVADSVMISVGLIPVIMMICAMHVAAYEISDSVVGYTLLIFAVGAGLGYISGFFYPIGFLPEAIRNPGLLLPAGVGFSYMRKALSGGELMTEMMLCIMYSVLFVTMAVIFRKHKTAGDRM